jgi:hypothetical protein
MQDAKVGLKIPISFLKTDSLTICPDQYDKPNLAQIRLLSGTPRNNVLLWEAAQ